MSTLFDLLHPSLPPSSQTSPDQQTLNYLTRLHTLSLSTLSTSEPTTLSDESTHQLRSLQSLAKRSYRSIDAAATSLSQLSSTLPAIGNASKELSSAIPSLDSASVAFTSRYGSNASSDSAENPILDRRRKALQLAENLDRVEDILSLPSLLSSTIASASTSSDASTRSAGAGSTHATYTQALDLQSHIRRLARLHPDSALVRQIATQAETAMSEMIVALMTSLRGSNVKLASGMRTIGLLRRIAPDLADGAPDAQRDEGSLGLLFLISRLAYLENTLSALEPLRELAEQESRSSAAASDRTATDKRGDWAAGQQTERYLKRFIEVFREVGFSVVSVYKGIFLPDDAGDKTLSAKQDETATGGDNGASAHATEQRIPPALATFTLHLTSILFETLQKYLPNVRDKSSRESLLTQVLYCAGSLGRLGADFGMMLALLEEDLSAEEQEQDGPGGKPEWAEAMERHKVQAGRLELLASGAGAAGAGAGAGGRRTTESAQAVAATS